MDNNNLMLNVNMNNLEEDERKQLMALIEKANKPKSKIWKPSNSNKAYFYITTSGNVSHGCWDGGQFDESRYEFGNCYPTKEDAEFAAEAHKVYAELKRYAEEHSDPIDWDNETCYKYSLHYNHYKKKIETTGHVTWQSIGIFFSSDQLAMQAVKEIGENRIKKYLFRVE